MKENVLAIRYIERQNVLSNNLKIHYLFCNHIPIKCQEVNLIYSKQQHVKGEISSNTMNVILSFDMTSKVCICSGWLCQAFLTNKSFLYVT